MESRLQTATHLDLSRRTNWKLSDSLGAQFDLKVGLALTLTAVVLLTGALGAYFYESHNTASHPVASVCSDPASISNHVYNPERLELVNPCIRASGVVDALREEADGDYHLILHLDPADANLTNAANDQYQHGDLVVEIICVLPITQQDATSACENYTNRILVPAVGQHIIVSGPYVLDTDHSNWAEIHPVYSLSLS